MHGEDTSGNIIHNCLYLVNIVACEHWDIFKEAQHINKSLSYLGDVFTALAQKNCHIPYKNNKLTLLLHNFLGLCNQLKILLLIETCLIDENVN